ncbi:flagellar export chaperone FliS [Salinimonas chungwhensis]|uniref:flagellar export chaperone FliS n=1 Tax=Salinimonas chungwhensis TaxID=265425 RepID=UPI00037B5D0F|nr:flagellar export chaperone FliS [Salinimonas chungwhensis]
MALKGINAYRKGSVKQDIESADPHKITLLLLQGALDRIAYAKGAMERKEYDRKADFISRTSAILMHLRDTLDGDATNEISANMFALYEYMIERLTTAHMDNNPDILDEVSGLLTPIRDAWVQIPEAAKQEAYAMQRQRQQAV